ncbi:MAG: MerR family transcriptional regulator [Acidimicrobiales bacterium]
MKTTPERSGAMTSATPGAHGGPGGPGVERATDYRVEELAAAAGITVELLRSYQSKGLLPAPRHLGRVAHYGPQHLECLRRIRDLKARGYTLKAIRGVLDGRDEGPSWPVPAGSEEELLTLREVADRAGVPTALLRSLEASGVLHPRRVGDALRYTVFDVRAVKMLLSLLASGLPMEEFMRVARVQLEAVDEVAEGALQLFLRYVRAPLREQGLAEDDEAERMVAGFKRMLEATTLLVSYNFQRTVLSTLQAEIDRSGSEAEQRALAREVRRRLDAALPG